MAGLEVVVARWPIVIGVVVVIVIAVVAVIVIVIRGWHGHWGGCVELRGGHQGCGCIVEVEEMGCQCQDWGGSGAVVVGRDWGGSDIEARGVGGSWLSSVAWWGWSLWTCPLVESQLFVWWWLWWLVISRVCDTSSHGGFQAPLDYVSFLYRSSSTMEVCATL